MRRRLGSISPTLLHFPLTSSAMPERQKAFNLVSCKASFTVATEVITELLKEF